MWSGGEVKGVRRSRQRLPRTQDQESRDPAAAGRWFRRETLVDMGSACTSLSLVPWRVSDAFLTRVPGDRCEPVWCE